eukprot:TRINITY_DN8609_c1_g1_i1.p2 TRINITY_DN8609_c1_g1~~TRINITY_DN8609_c1_g1_i1.p2  ORF type:complete len:139 (-),score=0.98 TRINITY_DN8609_c1_g1_i1:9-425(-)
MATLRQPKQPQHKSRLGFGANVQYEAVKILSQEARCRECVSCVVLLQLETTLKAVHLKQGWRSTNAAPYLIECGHNNTRVVVAHVRHAAFIWRRPSSELWQVFADRIEGGLVVGCLLQQSRLSISDYINVEPKILGPT